MLRGVPSRVLLVEDDDMIARPLVRTLEREGYDVDHVAQGNEALDRLRETEPHLVLLDLGLPDVDGLEVCRRARADGFGGGIIILTARGGELDRVVGLDIGADDYLAKPFALSELLARTRALLRRSGATTTATTETATTAKTAPDSPATGPAPAGGDDTQVSRRPASTPGRPEHPLVVDPRARRVWHGSEELAVTAKEFDVLALLDREPGAVLTREQIIDAVWDENWFGSTKMLDAAIGRLRQKLQDRDVPARIVTVRGIGFRLEREPSDA
jgi:DNA-binding response OmpR family regulator